MSVTWLRGEIRAAVANAVISDLVSLEHRRRHHGPPRRAGDLLGRVLLLTDGRREMLLVALDLLELYEPWLERFKAALARCTGVPAERQIVWCNHIHAAPSSDGVAEMPLAERLAWSIDKARADYAAAEVAFASRDLGPGWTIRRRFAIDGLETLCVMYNDGCRLEGDRLEVSQQVCAYLQERGVRPEAWAGFGGAAYCVSPRDVRLEVLAIRRAGDGCPVATVVRFPAHPVIASHSRIGNAIFPDYIGALREVFERARGGCVLFLQGPSGDVRPLHGQYGTEAAELYGRRLGRVTEAGCAGRCCLSVSSRSKGMVLGAGLGVPAGGRTSPRGAPGTRRCTKGGDWGDCWSKLLKWRRGAGTRHGCPRRLAPSWSMATTRPARGAMRRMPPSASPTTSLVVPMLLPITPRTGL